MLNLLWMTQKVTEQGGSECRLVSLRVQITETVPKFDYHQSMTRVSYAFMNPFIPHLAILFFLSLQINLGHLHACYQIIRQPTKIDENTALLGAFTRIPLISHAERIAQQIIKLTLPPSKPLPRFTVLLWQTLFTIETIRSRRTHLRIL